MKFHMLIPRQLLASLSLMVTLAAVSQVAMASSDTGTLLVAQKLVRCNAGASFNSFFGYSASLSFGSYSPTGLTGGNTVTAVYDEIVFPTCGGGAGSSLAVSGFSSNPGSTWLTSITCNGVTNNESSKTFFSYSSGVASWFWGSQFGLQSKSGSNVSCTIVHT